MSGPSLRKVGQRSIQQWWLQSPDRESNQLFAQQTFARTAADLPWLVLLVALLFLSRFLSAIQIAKDEQRASDSRVT